MLGEEWDRGGSHYLPLKGVSKKKKKGFQGKKFVGCSCQTAGSHGRKSGSRWEFCGRLEGSEVA